MKMKKTFCVLTILAVLLPGCGTKTTQDTEIRDNGAGRTVVIYTAAKTSKDDATRRAAEIIARKTGGTLFDIDRPETESFSILFNRKPAQKPFDSLDYDTFFVGAPIIDGLIPGSMLGFLAQTDFMDGLVVPFWISNYGEDAAQGLEERVQDARMLGGRGFFAGDEKEWPLDEQTVDDWAAEILAEIKARRTVGERAEDVMKAFSAAYPGRLGEAVFRNNDWAVEIDGVYYYYAQNRFLSEDDLSRAMDFRPLYLYRYSPDFPSDAESEQNRWISLSRQWISRRRGGDRIRTPVNPSASRRSPFYEAIWQTRTLEEARSHQQTIAFLGWNPRVHEMIVAPLALVEQGIRSLAETDEDVRVWLKSLYNVTAWNWRNIAGSENRSFHAYGVAVDLEMTPRTGMETYWLWTDYRGINWRTVPYDKRLNPPHSVVRVFEEHGFTWGGKWYQYDTMHFEYRPELLILSFQ
jgi:hypothetical protein